MNWGIGAAGQLFALANLAIAFGYLAVPFLVLPHLQLRRVTIIYGAIFFLGCTGSHLDMIFDVLFVGAHHPTEGWGDAFWHTFQAVGTWGFIIYFRIELIQARRLLERIEGETDGAEH